MIEGNEKLKTHGQEKPVPRVNPYKELKSYEEEDSNIFHGRTREKYDLFHQVRLNFLTVVFGKAGIGKTSLLNAGLFPLLRDEGFLPVRIRLNFTHEAPPLREQISRIFIQEIQQNQIIVQQYKQDKPAAPLSSEETLWEYFHRTIHMAQSSQTVITPVFVIDQFEEIFTLGKDHPERKILLDELYWLIENQLPNYLRDKLLKGDGEYPFIIAKPDVRVILSLREDYIPFLIQLKELIPSIDRVMIRVIHLNGTQAREVIQMPGGFQDERIVRDILRRFYPEGTPEEIMIADEKIEVEPTFLSLLCFQLFNKVSPGPVGQDDQDSVLQDFYNSIIKPFPEKIKIFIESRLLTEGGFRTPLYLEPNHWSKNYIEKLVDQRLLRRLHDGNKEYIEIIHDVLAPVINKNRLKRIEEEQKQKLKRDFYQKRKNIIVTSLLILIVIFSFLTFYAFYQKHKADHEYKNAQLNRLASEALLVLNNNNTKALRIAQEAYRMGLPNPPSRIKQILATAAYSSSEKPFNYMDIFPHNSRVNSVQFSPGGNYILTASTDGFGRLWTLQGKQLFAMKHTERVNSAVFSQDGKSILTASADSTAKLWNLKGQLIQEFKHDQEVYSAFFSPDDTLILSILKNGHTKLWDTRDKKKDSVSIGIKDSYIKTARFSQDGNMVYTIFSPGMLKGWDFKGQLIYEAALNNQLLETAEFSPDKKYILLTTGNNTAELWTLKGERIVVLNNHNQTVLSAIFSPDSRHLLTLSEDGTAKIWDFQGNVTANLKKYDGRILSAVFSMDSKRVITSSSDKTAKIWDIQGNLLVDLNTREDWVTQSLFSPDGYIVFTVSSRGTGKTWNIQGQLIMDLKHYSNVNSAKYSPDGQYILTASSDGSAKLWNVHGLILTHFLHDGEVNSAIFSPDGQTILTASNDNTALTWDLHGKVIQKFETKYQTIKNAEFSPDGKYILTQTDEEEKILWDIETTSPIQFEKMHEKILIVKFSPDSHLILTISLNNKTSPSQNNALFAEINAQQKNDDKNGSSHEQSPPTLVRIWQNPGIKQKKLKKIVKGVLSATFSPDGKIILLGYQDGTAGFWNWQEDSYLEKQMHHGRLLSIVYSPCQKTLLTASADKTAKLWDLKGNLLADLKKHTDWVKSAVFSPDGQYILTASSDGTAKLWDLNGQLLADLNKHNGYVYSAVFSPDGKQILTASADGTAKLWYTPSAIYEWLQTAPLPPLTNEDKQELGIK